MLMWYIILAIVVASTVGGLIYLSGRVVRFGLGGGKGSDGRQRKRIIGFSIVLLVFAVLSLLVNLMNAIVCLLHFVVVKRFDVRCGAKNQKKAVCALLCRVDGNFSQRRFSGSRVVSGSSGVGDFIRCRIG